MNSTVASRRPHWSHEYDLASEHEEYVTREAEATRITVAQPLIVPGLLQTPAYAEAVTASILQKKLDDPEVKRIVDVRLRRQRELAERMRQEASAPELLAIVTEAALRQPVGDTQLAQHQLMHLMELGRQPRITVVVVPTRSGGHPGLGGPFELLHFADEEPDFVFLESRFRDFVTRDEGLVDGYRSIVADLLEIGLSGSAAYAEIEHIRKDLEAA